MRIRAGRRGSRNAVTPGTSVTGGGCQGHEAPFPPSLFSVLVWKQVVGAATSPAPSELGFQGSAALGAPNHGVAEAAERAARPLPQVPDSCVRQAGRAL